MVKLSQELSNLKNILHAVIWKMSIYNWNKNDLITIKSLRDKWVATICLNGVGAQQDDFRLAQTEQTGLPNIPSLSFTWQIANRSLFAEMNSW